MYLLCVFWIGKRSDLLAKVTSVWKLTQQKIYCLWLYSEKSLEAALYYTAKHTKWLWFKGISCTFMLCEHKRRCAEWTIIMVFV